LHDSFKDLHNAYRGLRDEQAVLRERALPAVLVNAAVDGLGFPRVCTDDGHGVEMAYQHLAALGHERIALRHELARFNADMVPSGYSPL
jgi:DNA-binding LacI/PurR family transcriptional regulator